MRKGKIGIYAPYDWDEATYAATRLAELVRRSGCVPSYRSCRNTVTTGKVHEDWDDEVIRTGGPRSPPAARSLKKWIDEQGMVIWFCCNSEMVGYAKTKGVKNILVPMVHRLDLEAPRNLGLYDAIYSPNQATGEVLLRAGVRNQIDVKWDAGLPARLRHRFNDTLGALNEERVLVIPEWPITNEWGLSLAYTLRHLVDAEPDVYVSVVQLRQWPKVVNHAMLDLVGHSTRVRMLRKPTFYQLMRAYETHHWVLYLPERVNIGVRLAEAFSHGLPVVSLNMPPIDEFIKHGESGHLISCEHVADEHGRLTAKLNTHDTAEEIHQTVGDRQNWFMLTMNREERCAQRMEYFEHMWASDLGWF